MGAVAELWWLSEWDVERCGTEIEEAVLTRLVGLVFLVGRFGESLEEGCEGENGALGISRPSEGREGNGDVTVEEWLSSGWSADVNGKPGGKRKLESDYCATCGRPWK